MHSAKFVFLFTATLLLPALIQSYFLDQKYPDLLMKLEGVRESENNTWTAGINSFFVDKNLTEIRKYLGANLGTLSGSNEVKVQVRDGLPNSFDARQKWRNCANRIGEIRNQAACGSCWAVSAASVASDRNCIATNGRDNVQLSAEDILACCGSFCGYGCGGGWPIRAMEYWQKNGVVTGGEYGDSRTCSPYTIGPQDDHPSTPRCVQLCRQGYPRSWAADKHYARKAYGVGGGEAAIRQEILDNGPVVAAFTVYNDFIYYKSGIYQHSSGAQIGGHAVKIIGWGSQNGIPYWLVVNSWSSGWGEQGMFRIRRGNNECGFESNVVAGLAIVQ